MDRTSNSLHIAGLRGKLDGNVREVHDKYGEVIRAGPNVVPFISA